MKCKNCGSNLSMEMAFCPYCGKENEFAKKHREDMAKYEKDYANTKKEVLSNSKRFNLRNIRIAFVAVTVALATLLVIFTKEADYNSYSYREYKLTKNSPKYISEANEYLKNDDYFGFYEFTHDKFKPGYKNDLREYQDAVNATDSFVAVFDSIVAAIDIDTEYSSLPTSRIDNAVNTIFDLEKPSKYIAEIRTEEIQRYISDIVKDTKLMLKQYLHMTDEQIEEMRTMSDAQRKLIYEEALSNVKTK